MLLFFAWHEPSFEAESSRGKLNWARKDSSSQRQWGEFPHRHAQLFHSFFWMRHYEFWILFAAVQKNIILFLAFATSLAFSRLRQSTLMIIHFYCSLTISFHHFTFFFEESIFLPCTPDPTASASIQRDETIFLHIGMHFPSFSRSSARSHVWIAKEFSSSSRFS